MSKGPGFWTTFWLLDAAPTVLRRLAKLLLFGVLLMCALAVCGHG